MDQNFARSLRTALERQRAGPLREFEPDCILDLRVATTEDQAPLFGGGEPFESEGDPASALEIQRFCANARALLRLPDRRLLVCGISGAGKTFSLGRLARELCEEALQRLAEGRDPEVVPLWEPADALPENEVGAVEWLGDRLQYLGVFTGSRELAGHLLESGCLVLMVDSIHEVLGFSISRSQSLRRLASLRGVRMVATARPGYGLPCGDLSCHVLELQRLSPVERELMLVRLGLPKQAVEVLRRLSIEPRLRHAIEVPQIWSMAITLAQASEDISIVRREVMLYELFFERAFKSWDEAKESATAQDVQAILEMLGGTSAFRGGRDLPWSQAHDLVQRWAGFRGQGLNLQYDQAWPSRILSNLPRRFHPVLRGSAGEKSMGFSHGSLVDFLAARWLLEIYRIVPPHLLQLPPLADALSFALSLLEHRGIESDLLSQLDTAILRHGSLDLLLSWLRRTERDRIETSGDALRERVSLLLKSSQDVWRLRQLLRSPGLAWILRLLAPVLRRRAGKGGKGQLKPRSSRAKPGRSQRAVEELRTALASSDPGERADAAGFLESSRDPAAVDLLLPMLDPRREPSREVRAQVVRALGSLLHTSPETSPLGAETGELSDVLAGPAPELPARIISSLLGCLENEPADVVRGSILKVLGSSDDARAEKALVARLDPLREPEPAIRASAVAALKHLGDPRAAKALLLRLDGKREPEPAVRSGAAAALGSLGNPRAAKWLMRRLDPRHEPEPTVRSFAFMALKQLGEPECVMPLIHWLEPRQQPDAATRSNAALVLGRLADPRALTPLIECLNPSHETDPKVRSSAATALGQLGESRAVEPLIERLDPHLEADATVRGCAAAALGRLGSLRAVRPLIELLKIDEQNSVRGSAATALGRLGDLQAVPHLLERLAVETDPEVRGREASTLGRLGDTRAVGPLIALVFPANEKSVRVRRAATIALGRLGDSQAVPSLIALLSASLEPNPHNRSSAAAALGRLGDRLALPPLLQVLDPEIESDPAVRGSAAIALGYFGDRAAEEPLRLRLCPPEEGGEPDPSARDAFEAALDRLSFSGHRTYLNPAYEKALASGWQESLDEFFRQTASPQPTYFARWLELCLRSVERYAGGAVSRDLKEKDLERLLAMLLSRDESIQVLTQAEPADRQRTDLLCLLGKRERIVLELKLGPPSMIDRYLPQLKEYLKSLSAIGEEARGHFVLFDNSESPDWAENERLHERDGMSIWRVHVNRQPPSDLGERPRKPAAKGRKVVEDIV